MRNILQSLKEKVDAKEISIREAAVKLHNSGWTNFIDEASTKKLLNMRQYEKADNTIIRKSDTA